MPRIGVFGPWRRTRKSAPLPCSGFGRSTNCSPIEWSRSNSGTTTLFAALNVLEGTVIAACQPRHRHQEFLRFLNRIDESVDSGLQIHLVLDNYGTHKHPAVKEWLAERPRYHVHFTPTSSSWLNQIEHWFAEITRKRIRRGTFRSVRDLIKAIHDYIRLYNKNPRPFQWIASASQIIRKVNKYKDTSETGD